MHDQWIENVTFDELQLGQSAQLVRTLTPQDIQAFAAVSGDTNPAHLDPEYANDTLFHGVIAHGMWGGALISAVLGTHFPGPGTIYLQQELRFKRPVHVGDTLQVTVMVQAKDAEKQHVTLQCDIRNQHGESVLDGQARVIAPSQKVRRPQPEAPHIQLFSPQARLQALLSQAKPLERVRCAVVHPCDETSLMGALQAAEHGLIEPVLIVVIAAVVLVVALAAAYTAYTVYVTKQADILFLVSAAFSFAAASFFPALVLGIFWKRATGAGACLGMICGLGITAYYMVMNQPWLRGIFGVTSPVDLWWGIQPISAGVFGVPVGFAVAILVSLVTPAPGQKIQELVEHVRYPNLKMG